MVEIARQAAEREAASVATEAEAIRPLSILVRHRKSVRICDKMGNAGIKFANVDLLCAFAPER